jgi:hypothetical protein
MSTSSINCTLYITSPKRRSRTINSCAYKIALLLLIEHIENCSFGAF